MSNVSMPVAVVGAIILIVGLFYVVAQYTPQAPSAPLSGDLSAPPPADPSQIPAIGEVVAVSASSITVESKMLGAESEKITFAIDADTKIQTTAGKEAQVKVGDMVGIFSKTEAGGTLRALKIDILPAAVPPPTSS